MSTYTKEYHGTADAIITECFIFPAEDLVMDSKLPHFYTNNAVWDTGADTTIITHKVREGSFLLFQQGCIRTDDKRKEREMDCQQGTSYHPQMSSTPTSMTIWKSFHLTRLRSSSRRIFNVQSIVKDYIIIVQVSMNFKIVF